MKKLLTIVVFFSVFISLDAQTIYVDRLDPDGKRQIMTTGTKVKIEGYPYTFKLVAFTRGGSITMVTCGEFRFVHFRL